MIRKLLVLFFTTILLCLSCVPTRNALDQTTGYRDLISSVVLIRRSDGICSGFYIDQERVITNAHCLNNSNFQIYEVISYDQYRRSAELEESSFYVLFAVDTVRDLAVLREIFDEDGHHTVAEFYTGNYPQVGSPTIVIGHPAGQLFNLTTGIISRPGSIDPVTNTSYLFSSAPVWRGNSGGPIFNQYGEVIGVTRSIRQDQSFLGQFISYREVREFLNEIAEIENE